MVPMIGTSSMVTITGTSGMVTIIETPDRFRCCPTKVEFLDNNRVHFLPGT